MVLLIYNFKIHRDKCIRDRSIFSSIFQSNTTDCLIIYLFCKICVQEREPEIVLKKSKQKTVQESKQKYFTFKFTKPTKCISQLSWIGNFEENMDLSHSCLL